MTIKIRTAKILYDRLSFFVRKERVGNETNENDRQRIDETLPRGVAEGLFRGGDASLTANGEVFINNGSLTLNGALRVSGNITGTGAITVAEGRAMSRAGLEVGAGVSFKAGGSTDVGVSYEGKFKRHYTDHTALLNVRYNF